MKLFELVGQKKLWGTDAETLIRTLMDKGAFKKVLGAGAFGIAFELPNGTVLKCWGDDAGFEEWIQYCLKHKSNPYLPKFLGKIGMFSVTGHGHEFPTGIKYIRMEKLEKAKSLKDFGYDGEFFSEKRALHRFFSNLQDGITQEYGPEIPYPKKLNKKFYELSGLEIEKVTPKFEQFIKMVEKIMREIRTKGKGYSDPDLALRNFAMRGDQPVLLDPLNDVGSGRHVVRLTDYIKNPKDLISHETD